MAEGSIGKTLLTYEQVAGLFGVTTKTLRRMIDVGDFPEPTAYGKQIRWRADTVEEFIRAVEIVQSVKRQARIKDGTIDGDLGTIAGDLRTNAPEAEKPSSKRAKAD